MLKLVCKEGRGMASPSLVGTVIFMLVKYFYCAIFYWILMIFFFNFFRSDKFVLPLLK